MSLVAYLLSVLLTGGSYRYHHDLRWGEPERPGTKHLDYEKVSRKGRGGCLLMASLTTHHFPPKFSVRMAIILSTDPRIAR